MLNIFPNTLCSGDTIPLALSFTDQSTGTAHNLTGKTLGLTVKTEPEDRDDTLEAFHANIVGDTTGKIAFVISPLPAGIYWMDVKIWTTGATPSDRQTVIPSLQMKVIQSVTTRTA